MFVDADFGGLFKVEADADPNSARSRYGYLITFAGCPLAWKSKLLTEICLSTAESEYGGVSHSARVLVHVRRVLHELAQHMNIDIKNEARTYSTIFEDNNAALIVMTRQRITSRTRHWLIKWHWFWSLVNDGTLKPVKIATGDQVADIFTKGLTRVPFEYLRKKLMGW